MMSVVGMNPRITSPNGGEQWVAGRSQTVRWKGRDHADLEISFDGGAAWSTLAVHVQGSLFAVALNGTKLYDVEDSTFSGPGRIGVWTKADSVTHFDDLKVSVGK